MDEFICPGSGREVHIYGQGDCAKYVDAINGGGLMPYQDSCPDCPANPNNAIRATQRTYPDQIELGLALNV